MNRLARGIRTHGISAADVVTLAEEVDEWLQDPDRGESLVLDIQYAALSHPVSSARTGTVVEETDTPTAGSNTHTWDTTDAFTGEAQFTAFIIYAEG